MEDVKRLLYNYGHLVLGRSAVYGLAHLGTVMILVRILTPDTYGEYVLFLAIASSVSLLVLWSSASLVRFGREEYMTHGRICDTFWANIWILVPCCLLAVTLILTFREQIRWYVNLPLPAMILMCIYVVSFGLYYIVPVSFQAMGRMKAYSYTHLVSTISVLITMAIIWITGTSITIELAIGILVAGQLLSTIVGVLLLWNSIWPPLFPLQAIKRCFTYSWSLSFGGVSQQIVGNIDQLVIGINMAAVYVGIYHVAYLAYNYASMLPMLSISLAFPLVTSLMINKEHDKVKSYIRLHAPQVAFLWSLIMAIGVAFSRELTMVFGTEYRLAYMPMMILFAGLSLRIFSIIESPIVSAYGFIKQSVVVSVAIGVLNLALDVLLIPILGIAGAAIATSLSFAAGVAGHSFVIWHNLGLNDFRNYKWSLPALISLAGCWYADELWIRLLVVVGVTAISFLVAMRCKLFDSGTLTTIESIDMPNPLRLVIRRFCALVG